MDTPLHTGMLELHWEQSQQGTLLYMLFEHMDSGQLRYVGSFEQGPFDTALEVAQWAWKLIAREVPPATC